MADMAGDIDASEGYRGPGGDDPAAAGSGYPPAPGPSFLPDSAPVRQYPLVHPPVYVLLLNSNGWGHTMECLESLFRLRTPGVRVIVCDNGSDDDSIDYLQAWAEGRLDALPPAGALRAFCHPPIPKPVPYRIYLRADAEDGGEPSDKTPLILIRNGANLGFGAGSNVGLRYAIRHGDFQAVWILNNDTVVDPGTLDALLARMSEQDLGMCGSMVLSYDQPDRIQCQGGARFHPWLALSRLIGMGRPRREALPASRVEARLDHLYGASMLVSKAFLERVGLMTEERFLYFEEIDWALRAAGRFRLGFAPNSLVYHRKGGAAGTGTRRKGRSALATYYLARGRLHFTRAWFPQALPLVWTLLVLETLSRALRGEWARAKALLDALRGTTPRRVAP